MPISGTASTNDFVTDSGVDADANTTTTPLTLYDATIVGLYIKAVSGTHGTHVVTLQISPNGTDWFDTSHTITGIGELHGISCIAVELRAKVTTVEGATSTVDITVVVK